MAVGSCIAYVDINKRDIQHEYLQHHHLKQQQQNHYSKKIILSPKPTPILQDKVQLFPFRTFAMLVSFFVLVVVSIGAKFLFIYFKIDPRYDIGNALPVRIWTNRLWTGWNDNIIIDLSFGF